MSHASSTKRRAPRAATSRATARNDNQPVRAAGAGGPRDPRREMPVGAALEVARWGLDVARASVADFPEEAEAVDRVAGALELVITGRNPRALDQVDQVDLLTAASILITAFDGSDARDVAELVGLGLDHMTYGARGPRPRPAIAMPATRPAHGRRAPLLVRHLRLVP